MGLLGKIQVLACVTVSLSSGAAFAKDASPEVRAQKQEIKALVEDLFQRSGAHTAGLSAYVLEGVNADDPSLGCKARFERTLTGNGFIVTLESEGLRGDKLPSFRLSDADVLKSFGQDMDGFEVRSKVKELSARRVEKIEKIGLRIGEKKIEKKLPDSFKPVLGLVKIPKELLTKSAEIIAKGVRKSGVPLQDVKYLKHAANYNERLRVQEAKAGVSIEQKKSPTLLSRLSPLGLFLGFPHSAKANCTFPLPESSVGAFEPDDEESMTVTDTRAEILH